MRLSSWKQDDFMVQEGPRPGPPDDCHVQYYFLILKDDLKIFKYCVWMDRDLAGKMFPDYATQKDEAVFKYLREKGFSRVQEKIKSRDFKNICFLIDDKGEREVPLDELEEKLV